ncbi:opioid growth factor receptor-like protein 1 [Lissotriton helveticus]
MGNLFGGVSQKEPTALEECDSTWETDSGGEDSEELESQKKQRCSEQEEDGDPQGKGQKEGAEAEVGSEQSEIVIEQTVKPKRSFYAAKDMYKYRHQYQQNYKDLRGQNDLCNLRFYLNKIPFKPDGVYIEEILSKWKGDYDKLEHNHTYIQWLFPLREQGLNFYAKELTTYEIEEFKKTKEAIKKFMLAYKMMLEFFGIKLADKNGNVTRAANWQDRFQHLNESQHNYLRITRILKSLGELGYESFKVPLVKIFLQEALVENTIPNIKQSALEYFVYTIRDRRERRKLLRFAERHYHPPEHFIWGPPCKRKIEDIKTLAKPCSPCAPKCHISAHKRSKDTLTSGSPIIKTSSHKEAECKDKDVLNDLDGSEMNNAVSPEGIDEKKDGENQNCESLETDESVSSTENIPQAQQTDGDLEAVKQECENLESTEKISSLIDSACHSKLDLPAGGEIAPLSFELVPEEPPNS